MAKHDYDHVVFSYHGIPERHVLKGSHNGYCQLGQLLQLPTTRTTATATAPSASKPRAWWPKA